MAWCTRYLSRLLYSIVWKRLAERRRKTLLRARLRGVLGKLQREGRVTHLVAQRLEDHNELLGGRVTRSRDFG